MQKELGEIDQDEPYILVLGTPGDNVEYHIVLEREIWWEGRNLFDSLFLIFCAYYNFNLCYVHLLKPVLFFFFQCFIFILDKDYDGSNKPPLQLSKFLNNARKLN